MHRVVLFLLGYKGYQILNSAISSGYINQISKVIVGNDKNVHEDYCDHIVSLCKDYEITYCKRNDFCEFSLKIEDHFAIAAGWRWLIMYSFRKIVVFHDSLLPKYRGFNPLVTALLRKESQIGVTAIIANKEFDRGDIIGSRSININYPIKIADAIQLVGGLYFDLAPSIFEALFKTDCLRGMPQDETQASYSVWRDEEDYRIDWSRSADSILHFINCLSYPFKGASSICDGRLIRLLDAEVESDILIANRDVGKIIFVRDDKPVVICGVGLLRIMTATDNDGRNVLPFKKFRLRLS